MKEQIAALKRSSYVPLVGYAKLATVSAPLFPDLFMDRHVEFTMRLLRPARGMRVACYCAEGFDADTVITVAAGGAKASKRVRRGALIDIDLTFNPALEGEQIVTIDADKSSKPHGGADARTLSVVVERIELVH